VYAKSVSTAGISDPIVSDPGGCDAELRVVRRVVRVIDSVTDRDAAVAPKADQPDIARIHICT
jgi:hypothetical protein